MLYYLDIKLAETLLLQLVVKSHCHWTSLKKRHCQWIQYFFFFLRALKLAELDKQIRRQSRSDHQELRKDAQDYLFFVEQLELFASLAFDRNKVAIEALTKIIKFKDCFSFLKVGSSSNLRTVHVLIIILAGREISRATSAQVLPTDRVSLHWRWRKFRCHGWGAAYVWLE